MCLNGTFAAVMSGSKVVLQRIELDNQAADRVPGRGRIAPSGGGGSGRVVGAGPRRNFPELDDRDHGEATAVGLTEAFLIYATKARTLQFFCLSEWAPLAGVELKHASPVKRLWPNYLGTRVAFVDADSSGWLYSPATDKLTEVKMRGGGGTRQRSGSRSLKLCLVCYYFLRLFAVIMGSYVSVSRPRVEILVPTNLRMCACPPTEQIEEFPPNCRICMWDQVDRDILMTSDGKELHSYVHSHTTIRGSEVRTHEMVDNVSLLPIFLPASREKGG